MQQTKRVIALFDVDLTLTPARSQVQPAMLQALEKMRGKGVHFGIVSGSDQKKVDEQLGKPLCDSAEFCFYENGLDAYEKGKLIEKQSFKGFMGEDRIKAFVNFCLHYIADLDIPIKRGTFVEYRNGMVNISPIGRNCSKQERIEFEAFDKENKIRSSMIDALKN